MELLPSVFALAAALARSYSLANSAREKFMNAKTILLRLMLLGCLLLVSCGGDNNAKAPNPSPEKSAEAQQVALKKETARVVQHFWFDYNAEPNPGKRIWVHVDDSTWTELYPNGSQSRYKTGERTVVGGMTGTSVRKVAGDPNETWTLNDGSFEAFIPDKSNPRLILSFRHFQNGKWTDWKILALIHPIE
jgi:hypothetical protein